MKPFNLTIADLDRAFACARLAPLELVVVTLAREESYSRARRAKLADPLPFRLNLHAIAKATGFNRQNLREARERLVRDGIFVEVEGGFLIEKRFELWSGAHALTEVQVAFCRSVGGECGRSPRGGVRALPLGGSVGAPGGGAPALQGWECGRSPGGSVGAPPLTNKDRARVLEEEREEENSKSALTVDAREQLGGKPEDLGNDPDEVERVAIRAGNYRIAFDAWVRYQAKIFPIAWIDAAVAKAIARRAGSPHEYATSILQDWHRNGGPPAPRQREAAPDPKQQARDKRREDLARIKQRIAEGTLNV